MSARDNALAEAESFQHAKRQADEYIGTTGSQMLVDELRNRMRNQRRTKLATINTLVLLHHIDRLERERDRYRTALEIAGGSIEFEGNVAGAMDIICAALAEPAA